MEKSSNHSGPLQQFQIGDRLGTVVAAKLGPGAHQAGDKPVEIGFQRKFQPGAGLAIILLAYRVDGKRDARETLDLRHRLQLVGQRQRLLETARRNQDEHEALLKLLIVRVEIQRTAIVVDRRIHIVVDLGDTSGQIGAGERTDLDLVGIALGERRRAYQNCGRQRRDTCQPSQTFAHHCPFRLSRARSR